MHFGHKNAKVHHQISEGIEPKKFLTPDLWEVKKERRKREQKSQLPICLLKASNYLNNVQQVVA